MKKKVWTTGAIILIIIVILGILISLFINQISWQGGTKNLTIINKYSALKDDQFQTKRIYNLSSIIIYNSTNHKYICNNQEVSPILAYESSHAITNQAGDGSTKFQVIDCNNFYLITILRDSGPTYYGPFTNRTD